MDETEIALVHGPGWPVAPPDAIRRLFEALQADPHAAAAIVLGPQTDTLKSIDPAGLVSGTLDRSAYRAVHSPVAVRPAALPEAARRPARPGGPVPSAADVLAALLAADRAVVEVALQADPHTA